MDEFADELSEEGNTTKTRAEEIAQCNPRKSPKQFPPFLGLENELFGLGPESDIKAEPAQKKRRLLETFSIEAHVEEGTSQPKLQQDVERAGVQQDSTRCIEISYKEFIKARETIGYHKSGLHVLRELQKTHRISKLKSESDLKNRVSNVVSK